MTTAPVPECPVIGPDGDVVVVRPASPADRVDDLRRALGLPTTRALAIDDHVIAAAAPLVESGLRAGARVAVAEPTDPTDPTEPVGPPAHERHGGPGGDIAAEGRRPHGPGMEAAVVAGPACTGWVELRPGRHLLGRAASATIRVVDPTVELHHAVVDVSAGHEVTVTQLTGRTPLESADGIVRPGHGVSPGDRLLVGTSLVEFRAPQAHVGPSPTGGSIVPDANDPWRLVVRRGPSLAHDPRAASIAVPTPPAEHRMPSATGLIGAGIMAVGAGVFAAILGQPLFALFGLLGAVAAAATWGVGAVGALRARRRDRRRHAAEVETFRVALDRAHQIARRRHTARHPSVVDVIADPRRDPWARRRPTDGALVAALGTGTWRWTAPIAEDQLTAMPADLAAEVERCERLVEVAVPVTVEPGGCTAVHGDERLASSVMRSIVAQLAVRYGPADWRLVVLSGDPSARRWAGWLPHAVDVVGGAAGLADLDDTDRLTVVVVDRPDALATRTGPLRRFLDRTGAACLVEVPTGATVPAVCGRVLEVGCTGVARWRGELADGTIRVAGIDVATAESIARRLAPLVDPEHDGDGTGALPERVRLAELDGGCRDARRIVERWRAGGADPEPAAPIGVSADGIVDVDLVRDGPHGLIAGTTGSGKSELLRTLVVAFATAASPDHLSFVLVDFKGGATFDACADLPHTVGTVTDLDEGLAERALASLDAEVRRRERLLRNAGAEDLPAYRQMGEGPLPRLVIVVDEFATLAAEIPDFVPSLVAVAQRGRSLGLHLLLATQRPAGVVTDDIRANTNLRLALRLHDRSDAQDVVGEDTPAGFARSRAGRAALRLGPGELVVFQAASCAGPVAESNDRLQVVRAGCAEPTAVDGAPSELAATVAAIREAAALGGFREPHRPWLDPLPAVLSTVAPDRSAADVEMASLLAVGLVDDPSAQTQRPLRWTPEDGSLLVAGSLGSGCTSTLLALVSAAVAARPPSELHLYVIDAVGDARWAEVATWPHCGAVVGVTETERLARLLRRLAGELDERSAGAAVGEAVVLVVDGVGSLRRALANLERLGVVDDFDRIVRDGPAVGIVTLAATDGTSASALALPVADRWVHHLADPDAARSLGVASVAAVPGRLRIASTGLEAHVVAPGPLPEIAAAPGGPPPVDVLPPVVDPSRLQQGSDPCCIRVTEVGLVVGLSADELEPESLLVPHGDHVLVAGASQSGTTTALRQLVAAWRSARPDGVVVQIDPHRALPPDLPDHRPLLVAADQADRIDDPDSRLTALVAAKRTDVTVVAAARLEAVRTSYGHWTRDVARSRCGLIMTAPGDVDGDLLGATLPRHTIVPPRPGLAWIVDRRGQRLVQVAARMPE